MTPTRLYHCYDVKVMLTHMKFRYKKKMCKNPGNFGIKPGKTERWRAVPRRESAIERYDQKSEASAKNVLNKRKRMNVDIFCKGEYSISTKFESI